MSFDRRALRLGPDSLPLLPGDSETLEAALVRVAERHESLRTTFATVNEEPVQLIASEPTIELEQISLIHLPVDEREKEVQKLVDREAATPFNLWVGPLFRAKLILLQEDEAVVVLNMHHIISDGWSMGILIQEIGAIYEAMKSELLKQIRLQKTKNYTFCK